MRKQKLIVNGGTKISGEIRIQGAKNSMLPILVASILCDGETTITNCPRLSDVFATCRILKHLGCVCDINGHSITIKSSGKHGQCILMK